MLPHTSRPRALLILATVLWSALAAAPAWSQGSDPEDAGDDLPDASVDLGGADRDNEEQDDSTGRTPTRCRSTADCDPGFVCEDTHCVYVGTREAQGCTTLSFVANLVVSSVVLFWLIVLRRRAQGK